MHAFNNFINSSIKGMELGNDKVQSWLISFVITILTGILITQPLQVNKIYFLIRINYLKSVHSIKDCFKYTFCCINMSKI